MRETGAISPSIARYGEVSAEIGGMAGVHCRRGQRAGIGAALVTGNAVVHKPSERCPGTGRRFAEIVVAHLRGGVLEILDGDGSVGARLSAAEVVDVVAHVPARSVSRWNVSTSSRRSSGRRPAA